MNSDIIDIDYYSVFLVDDSVCDSTVVLVYKLLVVEETLDVFLDIVEGLFLHRGAAAEAASPNFILINYLQEFQNFQKS